MSYVRLHTIGNRQDQAGRNVKPKPIAMPPRGYLESLAQQYVKVIILMSDDAQLFGAVRELSGMFGRCLDAGIREKSRKKGGNRK